MQRFIILSLCILWSISSFAQNGGDGGGGSNGGPGIILKYIDSNGFPQEYVVTDELNIPNHLLDEYMEEVGRRLLNTNSVIVNKLPSLRKGSRFVSLGEAHDITTLEGRNLDREALRSIRPEWMKEERGNLYVERGAPIYDYQRNDGEIVTIDWQRFPEDDEE